MRQGVCRLPASRASQGTPPPRPPCHLKEVVPRLDNQTCGGCDSSQPNPWPVNSLVLGGCDSSRLVLSVPKSGLRRLRQQPTCLERSNLACGGCDSSRLYRRVWRGVAPQLQKLIARFSMLCGFGCCVWCMCCLNPCDFEDMCYGDLDADQF